MFGLGSKSEKCLFIETNCEHCAHDFSTSHFLVTVCMVFAKIIALLKGPELRIEIKLAQKSMQHPRNDACKFSSLKMVWVRDVT